MWENEGKELLYRLPKPRPDGQTVLRLTPLEFIERLAALIPPPRRHRHRYHGVLAPNSPLRAAVTARAGKPISAPNEPTDTRPSPPGRTAHDTTRRCPSAYLWAVLLARIYECFPLTCRQCGAPMGLIAFITAPASVKPILEHLGLPTQPPSVAPARDPPHDQCVIDQTPRFDTTAPDPDPGFQFDQSVSW